MDLKELIKEVEYLKKFIKKFESKYKKDYETADAQRMKLIGIKQTIEAVDKTLGITQILEIGDRHRSKGEDVVETYKDWKKLKQLVGLKDEE